MKLYPSSSIYPQSYLYPNSSLSAHFIFDRTIEDVELVELLNEKMLNKTASTKEVALWTRDLKGAINKSDLKRLENAYAYLNENAEFNLHSTSKLSDIPTYDYFKGIQENTNMLIDSNYVLSYLSTPELPLNTYQKWNTVEEALYVALNTFLRNKRAVNYAGDGMYMDNNTLI